MTTETTETTKSVATNPRIAIEAGIAGARRRASDTRRLLLRYQIHGGTKPVVVLNGLVLVPSDLDEGN